MRALPVWVIALVAVSPIWLTRYLPIEDFPIHLATLRVVHSLHDPAFGLDEHFVLTLGRTQYVGYYLLGSALAAVFGVVHANLILLSAYVVGTLFALRFLLSALEKDVRACFLALPLLYNPLFMIGLFPFLLGIPMLFLALAGFLRYLRKPSVPLGVLTALSGVALFFWHVVPFGVLAIGMAATFPWSSRRASALAAAPLVPVVGAAAFGLFGTDGGSQLLEALGAQRVAKREPFSVSLAESYQWIGDQFRDRADELIFAVFAAIVVAIVIEGFGRGWQTSPRRYALVPLACAVLYFLGGRSHGFIWPLSQRFALLTLLLAIPLVPLPAAGRGKVALGAVLAVSLASIVNTAVHFRRFEREEVDHFDDVLAQMEPRKRVAALIFDSKSSIAHWNPFLHFVSYYQAQKGGVVQFSFAGYNHWPFDYKKGQYPPPGGPARPRWEWTPEAVSVREELYPYYDYVLTRGDGFDPPAGTFHVKARHGRWTLWQR